ncbi:hypothetical protein GCM10009730_59890 [Streptomyces albidochromogenes]
MASRYGLEAKALRSYWHWCNHQPKHESGATRADAEVLLNAAGRRLRAGLCGVEDGVLARVLPSWAREGARLPAEADGVSAAIWRIGGVVAGPTVFGCGCAPPGVRELPCGSFGLRRGGSGCVRHGRWLLDADADQPFEHLDVRHVPEVGRGAAAVDGGGAAGRAGRGRAGAGIRFGACGGGIRPLAGSGRQSGLGGCIRLRAGMPR